MQVASPSTLDTLVNSLLSSANSVPSETTYPVVDSIAPVEEIEAIEPAATFADAYTISEDGHFVGEDGFEIPGCYAEFQHRFPNHIRNFVRRHMTKSSRADQEDRESELHIYLMTLPETSKYREPGFNGRANGCSDRVQTFHPDRAYGASKPRFLNFINFLLMNCFISLTKKSSSNPIERVNNLVYFQGSSENPSFVDDEYLHTMVTDVYLQSTRAQSVVEDGVLLQEVAEYVRGHNPELMHIFDVLLTSDTFIEAQQTLGLTDQLFTRARNRLYVLMDCYTNGTLPPRQRKIYRARAAKVIKVVEKPVGFQPYYGRQEDFDLIEA